MGLRNPGTQLEDRTGDLVSDHARSLGRIGVEAQPRHHVGEVDACRGDLDAHLPRSEHGVGALLYLQHGRPAVLGDDDSSH